MVGWIRHSGPLSRRTALALAAGFATVFALLVALFASTRTARPAEPAPARERPPSPAPVAPVARAQPSPERAQPAAPVMPRAHASMPAPPPVLAPGPPPDHELKFDANGKLVPIVPVDDLREQLHLTDAGMAECIERSGHRPTGKATLTFRVAARNGKLAITSTGVLDDEALGEDPALLECMHRTANALAVALDRYPVPELGTPITVRRHVRVDAGVVVENSMFDFSYKR